MKTLRLIQIFAAALSLSVASWSSAAGAEKKASAVNAERSAKVDINTAHVSALETLPGVGPLIAQEIVKARPFSSVDDLERVHGIGPSKMAVLRDQVTVSHRAAAPAAKKARTTSSSQDSRSSRPSATADSHGRINLNTASREELESLPEIGPVKAQAIIDARPFSSKEDVMRVKGIKEGTYAVIKDRITVR